MKLSGRMMGVAVVSARPGHRRGWGPLGLFVLLVLLVGCSSMPGGDPDYDAIPPWVRTYVDLADRSDVDKLAAHLHGQPTQARALIAELGPGQGWTVQDVRSTPHEIEGWNRDVVVTVHDSAGRVKTLTLRLYWQDWSWRTTAGIDLSTPPPGGAEIVVPSAS